MGKVDEEWLHARGDLHHAGITGVRFEGTNLEVDIDDEWVNERGLGLPKGEKQPVTLVFSDAVTNGTISEGGWISELRFQTDGSFLFVFNNGDTALVRASTAEVRLLRKRSA